MLDIASLLTGIVMGICATIAIGGLCHKPKPPVMARPKPLEWWQCGEPQPLDTYGDYDE